MNTGALIEYLSHFDPDAPVSVIAADVGRRLHYPVSGCRLIFDPDVMTDPAIMLELGESCPLDEEEGEHG